MTSHQDDLGYRSPKNALYFGDNLNVLRESIADESVDLIRQKRSPHRHVS